jgi:hypothetical protein
MSTNENASSIPSACGNCRTPLDGPYCHQCGQPVKGLVRPLSGWIADFFDSVFNYDGRLPRTLVPLLLRPGFLTREYIAGRRVRYVTPVRLFLFLTIALFIAIRLVSNLEIGSVSTQLMPDDADMARVESVVGWLPEEERRNVLDAVRNPPAARQEGAIQIDGLDEDREPLAISWLSDGMNAELDAAATHMAANMRRINQDPTAFIEQMLSVAPQTLFFMLPVFALLLKLFYLFKRRLYTEHLLVALHSHAFIAFALLVIVGLATLSAAVADIAWLAGTFDVLAALLWVWIPVTLFLTQKRVYGQGWMMTTLKFTVIGILYTILLTFGSILTLLLTLLLW